MAVLPIRITGEPVLHTVAAPVEAVDDELRTLVADMVETMHAAPGVGLAAPQVGVGLRLFVWSFEVADGELSEGVAINPRLWIAPMPLGPLDEEVESEGCLSIPGERFPLRRSPAAILEATDLDGQAFEIRTSGWLARIFQHEYDHLDGVLYADRLAFDEARSLGKVVKRKAWGIPGRSWTPGVDQIEP
ncbi:peptide deformylase [Pseudolysinimonas sp.]|uniref:peptide deformylase n=1 Tax=Pseudolysinimonas sp. TaxID=2680009 RepID=UPI003F80F478